MEHVNEVNYPQGAVKENYDSLPETLNQFTAGATSLNELRLLLRIEREDSHPLPVGTYSDSCVCRNIEKLSVHRINMLDTVIDFAADVSVPTIAQTLHTIKNWEGKPSKN